MATLSEDKIELIRSSVDIVDVISQYLPLVRKGRNYWAVCPFHDDTNPSMSISQDKQIYKCFVCGAGGNVYTFLQNHLTIPFLEAVKIVAGIARIDVSEIEVEKYIKPVDEALKPLYQMHEDALSIYKHYLHTQQGIDGLDYLHHRKLSDEIIEHFQIGYAPDGEVLTKAFISSGFKNIDIARSGLANEGNNTLYDKFKDRVVFPLWDLDGKPVGFSGRKFRKSQEDEAKYINSPESSIFIKGNTLYNYHFAKEVARKEKSIYLLEGFMDVIALYRAGVENAVAIMGTALTEQQIKAIHKLTNNVILCLDGDKAGKAATLKAYEKLVTFGFSVKIVKMTDDKDPDEIFTNNGADYLLKVLNNQVSGLEFLLEYYYEISNMDNFEERRDYLNKMAPEIAKLDDPLEVDYYSTILSSKSGFERNLVNERVGALKANQTVKPIIKVNDNVNYDSLAVRKMPISEVELLFYMMYDKKVANQYEKELGYLYTKDLRIIASYLIDYYRKNDKCDIAEFVNMITNQRLIDLVIEISDRHMQVPYEQQAIDDYIKHIKFTAVEEEISELKNKLESEVDVVQKAKIALQIQQLKSKL